MIRIENQHIGRVELRRRREIHHAFALRASLVEQFRPFGEKPGMIMLPGSVRLYAGANNGAQTAGFPSGDLFG